MRKIAPFLFLAACQSEVEIANIQDDSFSVPSCAYADPDREICIENLSNEDSLRVVWFVGLEVDSDVVQDINPAEAFASVHDGLFCVLQDDLAIANVLGPNLVETDKYLCATVQDSW